MANSEPPESSNSAAATDTGSRNSAPPPTGPGSGSEGTRARTSITATVSWVCCV